MIGIYITSCSGHHISGRIPLINLGVERIAAQVTKSLERKMYEEILEAVARFILEKIILWGGTVTTFEYLRMEDRTDCF